MAASREMPVFLQDKLSDNNFLNCSCSLYSTRDIFQGFVSLFKGIQSTMVGGKCVGSSCTAVGVCSKAASPAHSQRNRKQKAVRK